MKLDTLEIGKDAVVASVASDDQALRQHILDMGLTPGTEVTMMKYAPMGDPLEIRLRGYELTLRKDDAARIELVGVHDTDTGPRANAAIGTTEHPALGEGTYSPRAAKTAVPEGAPLHFALAGNQNCGKTTLFNQLTGSNQHVGNFPGVTVDRKDGTIRNHPEAPTCPASIRCRRTRAKRSSAANSSWTKIPTPSSISSTPPTSSVTCT